MEDKKNKDTYVNVIKLKCPRASGIYRLFKIIFKHFLRKWGLCSAKNIMSKITYYYLSTHLLICFIFKIFYTIASLRFISIVFFVQCYFSLNMPA